MVLEASWLQHQEKEEFSVTLQGKKASVRWPTGNFHTVVNRTLIDGVILPQSGLGGSHAEEIKAFAKTIREKLPSSVPIEETIDVIAILEAIMKSNLINQEVVLPTDLLNPAH